ncbi:MAG: hypothetical protein HC769_18730 [Cyanobacteria bacterium CRU_2_1]|nr:hypothetical protein [Cyanobacteria bacterium RU_5_0]NJR60677.1 hypothetical protein [Cyanobacteria bacterium CRU_2_1]
MNLEEFRNAYLEAQNGLGNDLQTLINLTRTLTELASRLNDRAESIQANYARMNAVVEQFLNEQENS